MIEPGNPSSPLPIRRQDSTLCPKCGKHPPVTGSHTTCEYCRDRRNANERDSWSARRADGLCGKCGASVDHGTARCAGCAAIQARSVSPERKNAATRKRYARRRARRLAQSPRSDDAHRAV